MGSRRAFVKGVVVALATLPLVGHVGRAFGSTRKRLPPWKGIERTSVITCPACGKSASESMAHESVKRVYHCQKCLKWVAPKHGDHCIYDSYGSVGCPAHQLKLKLRNKGAS